MNDLWAKLALAAGLKLSLQQDQQLARFIDLLLDANQRMNLTRIDTRASAETAHIGDALTVLPLLPPNAFRLADIGSGGGIPGIPIAIVMPDVSVTLVESTGKKAAFLAATADQLGLANVSVCAVRAEELARSEARGSFDVVIARAVAEMRLLVEWCLPLVKIRGNLLAMKGARISQELPAADRAIRLLGGGDAIVHPVTLPGTDHHVIVQIQKLQATPARFPRPNATMRAVPL
jgi:16S rRNA (guanine527-N7)-methyltransferase